MANFCTELSPTERSKKRQLCEVWSQAVFLGYADVGSAGQIRTFCRNEMDMRVKTKTVWTVPRKMDEEGREGLCRRIKDELNDIPGVKVHYVRARKDRDADVSTKRYTENQLRGDGRV